MGHARLTVLGVLFSGIVVLATAGLPNIRDSITHPVHVYEGDDALITCVVRNIEDNTVMWKKEDRERHSRRVLTAGDARVTADKRFNVLHDTGGDVWVLVIKSARPKDSGIYVCEVNSNPILRSFHKLSVLPKSLTPPGNGSDVYESYKDIESNNHNYTDCCLQMNVTQSCIGFCNIQSILEGNTGQDPEKCETDFPSIVKCMADGRNHVPCCIQENVPDICQDVCRGDYTIITDKIKTHFSCSAYTEQTLACIMEGIEILPSSPVNVEIEALTEKSFNVSWQPPLENRESVTEYVINITTLSNFDAPGTELTPPDFNKTAVEKGKGDLSFLPQVLQIKVPASENSKVINNLNPFTMYEISVTSFNVHGSSLPSYRIRALTLSPGMVKPTSVNAPQMPDIKSCCVEKGISHATCLNRLCDPRLSAVTEVTDLMICAPWASETFSCLANGIDHSSCCRARGLPDLCVELCTGNVTQMNFTYFKCLKYMGDYGNCLLQGYGVLPSSPTEVHVSNTNKDFVILQWGLPKTLSDTVVSYNIHYRMMATYDNEYRSITKVQQPYVLEKLLSGTEYEVYVEAVNEHGVSEPSPRVIFRTKTFEEDDKIESAQFYNETACCVQAGLSDVCMPLCSYDASMSDIKALALVCTSEFPKLIKCGAGGRNHQHCCKRRGVPTACVSLCSGVIVDSIVATATTCLPYIGNIVQCFEEGTGLLPGPITELHATVVTDTSVTLIWEAPEDSNATGYTVHYQKLDNTSMHETVLKLDQQKNVTETHAIITNLDTGALYTFFVLSRNEHGTSLPSSLLQINVSESAFNGQDIQGVTSPPHSLAVSSHSATWVTIAWQPPEFSHPTDVIKYKLHHKAVVDETFQVNETTVNSVTLEDLKPNTQYIVYVTAISDKGDSQPSETLIAWTDPAYPAFVEPPTVHPINLVMEGSSMTILCIAMGTPMPTISLYISGRLVRQDTTRHMVTVIHNVTRDMDQISCYADNGYGTPMQATKKITISRIPHITAPEMTVVAIGDSATLECVVDAHPDPKLMFWRDHDGRVPVIQGGAYDINIQPTKDEEAKFLMKLTISSVTEELTGQYYCHAENAFGSSTQPLTLRTRPSTVGTMNVTQCCAEQNVSSTCMDACSFFLDIDAVIDRAECINDFDKLMKCAADGSDHRSCCSQWGVPRRCLDWCQGEPVLNNKLCVLSYTKQIVSCFHEGRDRLPGPPQNVRIELVDSHSIRISWEPPTKNPHTVDLYRVFWRPVGTRVGLKNDTKETSLQINGLKDSTSYEIVLKAGNRHGTSTLTEPLRFTTGKNYIVPAASRSSDSPQVGVAVAIILALLFVAAIVVATVWFLKRKRLLGLKSNGGVAFENPSYLREVNMDHIQVPTGETANGSANGWKQETLHVPSQSSEVNPTLYEELKLGQDGAGFRRLKP